MNNSTDERIKQTYEYIRKHYEIYSCPPTVREIMSNVNVKSTATVSLYLKKLEEQGYIICSSKKSRGIELIEKQNYSSDNLIELSVLGDIAAGNPRLAIEESDGEKYVFSKDLFSGSGDRFLLNVVGSSMINAGIFDGDILVVKKQSTASNGTIVAALIDGDCVTVKRYFHKNNKVYLHPENDAMQDIVLDKDVSILGIVIGLIRTRIS